MGLDVADCTGPSRCWWVTDSAHQEFALGVRKGMESSTQYSCTNPHWPGKRSITGHARRVAWPVVEITGSSIEVIRLRPPLWRFGDGVFSFPLTGSQ